MHNYLILISVFLSAFLVTFMVIPNIIEIAQSKGLCDEPNSRSSHKKSTASLGGIGIFFGFTISLFFWLDTVGETLKYMVCAGIIMISIGLKDDIIGLSPRTKFIGQIVSLSILISFANLVIPSLLGVLGITNYWEIFHIPLTLFLMLLLVNGMNLIDGINGLASGITLIISLFFGVWFYLVGMIEFSLIAISLAGAVMGFLYYNITPAKIFLGDTGSLFIGLIVAVLSIQFLIVHQQPETLDYSFENAPVILFAILIIPIFDTIRVFFVRLRKGKSPFLPDRNHLYHMLVDMDLSHMQATGVLMLVNMLFFILAYSIRPIAMIEIQFIILIIVAMAFSKILTVSLSLHKKKKQEARLLFIEKKQEAHFASIRKRKDQKITSSKEEIKI